MLTYHIHDNGGRPFKVTIDTTRVIVKVYKQKSYNEQNTYYETKPILTFSPRRVFIPNPRPEDLDEYEAKLDWNEMKKLHTGSSLLLELYNGNYVSIGESIYEFKALARIFDYFSIVGNSDVPYPTAVDVEGNFYLLLEHVVLVNQPNSVAELIIKNGANYASEPYDYYYKSRSGMNELLGVIPLEYKVLQKRLY